MTIEIRIQSHEVELRDENKIVGRAAVYYDGTPDTQFHTPWVHEGRKVVERIMPTFFDSVMDQDVRALFNHNPDNVLGRTTAGTLKLTNTPTGLDYEIDPPDTELGKSLRVALKRKDVTGSSFQFSVKENLFYESSDEKGDILVRELHAADSLLDVGPVTYPAYPATSSEARYDHPGGTYNEACFKEFQELLLQHEAEEEEARIALMQQQLSCELATAERMVRFKHLTLLPNPEYH